MSTTAGYIPKSLSRPADKPLLIWMAPPFMIVMTALSLAFTVIMAMSVGGGVIELADSPVSGRAYVALVLPVALASNAMTIAAAYGLAANRDWARVLMTHWLLISWLAWGVVLGLAGVPIVRFIMSSGLNLLWVAACFWYFYRYKPVVRYYARLTNTDH